MYSAVNLLCVCPWAYMMNVSPNFLYFVCLVCALIFSP